MPGGVRADRSELHGSARRAVEQLRVGGAPSRAHLVEARYWRLRYCEPSDDQDAARNRGRLGCGFEFHAALIARVLRSVVARNDSGRGRNVCRGSGGVTSPSPSPRIRRRRLKEPLPQWFLRRGHIVFHGLRLNREWRDWATRRTSPVHTGLHARGWHLERAGLVQPDGVFEFEGAFGNIIVIGAVGFEGALDEVGPQEILVIQVFSPTWRFGNRGPARCPDATRPRESDRSPPPRSYRSAHRS